MHNHQKRQPRHQPKLFEGLRPGDLTEMVSERFTIDQYKSKMGKDEDIIVVAFKVKDKYPAIDMMEFIEKGYPFVLDADMSTGEETDGQYRVFVEFDRSEKFPQELDSLLRGLDQLCKCDAWRFKYFKDVDSHTFTNEAVVEFVPLTPDAYREKVKSEKISNVNDVLDQGIAQAVDVDESNNVIFSKPYSGDLTAKLEAIGPYEELQEYLRGAIQLDESSNSQILFLQKYLGNYEIHKIDNKFLVRNNHRAIILSKDRW